jgi:hypothetical protein
MRRQTVRLEATWLRQTVEPFADTAGRPAPGPSDRVAARRTDALHKVNGADSPVQTQRTRTPERADTDAGHRASTPDIGQPTVDIA